MVWAPSYVYNGEEQKNDLMGYHKQRFQQLFHHISSFYFDKKNSILKHTKVVFVHLKIAKDQ